MSDAPDGRRRWLFLVLVASLGLNCLLAGYIAGRHIPLGGTEASGRPDARRPPANPFQMRLQELPKDERQKFQRVFQTHRPAIAGAREGLAAARSELARRMAAEPYDQAGMNQAFAEVRTRTETLQAQVQTATAEALAALTPESRRHLAEPPTPP